MTTLQPLQTLYEPGTGDEIALPEALAAFYGALRLSGKRPYVLGNFVSTIDGVVALAEPGLPDAGQMAAPADPDKCIMGLLRAVADVAIAGAGTLRAVPDHIWTSEFVYPPMAAAYHQLRDSLGNDARPLNVIVTARGDLDLKLPVFQSSLVETVVATTLEGKRALEAQRVETPAGIVALGSAGNISARAVVEKAVEMRPGKVMVLEGGPRLMGDFLAEGVLDELFLTLAPQIAGRLVAGDRPGLVMGRTFAPTHPMWMNIAGVKRAESQLFLRYRAAP